MHRPSTCYEWLMGGWAVEGEGALTCGGLTRADKTAPANKNRQEGGWGHT